MKYIILDGRLDYVPFIFSERENHFDVAQALIPRFGPVLSAGFCGYNEDYHCWTVYGKSVSLGVESRPEDQKILNKMGGI